MVPKEGIEPSLSCLNGFLRPARLPIPPLRHKVSKSKIKIAKRKIIVYDNLKKTMIYKFAIFLALISSLIFNDYNSSFGALGLFTAMCLASFKVNYLEKKHIIAIALFVISFLYSQIPSQSLEQSLLYLAAVLGPAVFFIKDSCKQKLFKALSILMFGLAIYQYFNFDFGFGTYMNIFDPRQIYPNSLASLMLLITPFIQGPLVLLNIITIFLSKSRIALALILAFMGVKIYFSKSFKAQSKKYLLFLGVVSMLGIAILSSMFSDNYQHKLQQAQGISSATHRLEFFRNTPKLFDLKQSLVGTGAESFQYLYPQVQTIPLNKSIHAHNLLLDIGLEHGFLILAVCIYIFWGYLRQLPRASILALVPFTLHNMLDLNINFGLSIFVLIVLISQKAPDSKAKLNNIQKTATVLLTTIAVLSLVIIRYPQYASSSLVAHKDYLVQEGKLSQHIQQNPIDTPVLYALAQSTQDPALSLRVFKQDPWTLEHLELVLKLNPDMQIDTLQVDSQWLKNYKDWYLRHVKYNTDYINYKSSYQTLENIFSDTQLKDLEYLEQIKQAHAEFLKNYPQQ